MLLIDTRDSWEGPEEPERRRGRPDLTPVLRFVHVIIAFIGGVILPGWAGVALVFLSIALLCRAVSSLLPYTEGLREYRQ